MATYRPFRGLRPTADLAAQVASKPYDVLSTEEARREAAGNPLSFLRVGKPEIDLPPGTDVHSDIVYETGRANQQMFMDRGALVRDPRPYYYLYALTMGSHTQTGIVGCASVAEYRSGIVRRHELTRPDKETDRMRHILTTGAQSGPIFLTFRARPDIGALTARLTAGSPEYDFVTGDGVRHRFWVVRAENDIAAVRAAFDAVPMLYIADGHHRSAAAGRAADASAADNPAHTGSEEYNFFLAVAFPDDQLRILEYNRVVKDLNGLAPERFLAGLRESFTVEPTSGRAQPVQKGEFGMYLGGSWYTLRTPDHVLSAPDPVERLDVSILQNRLLRPLLGVEDPRTDTRIDFVGGIRGLDELEQRVNSGEMTVAFALYPTGMDELLTIADAERIMPPKSTWFEPKLRDGMVVHLLQE